MTESITVAPQSCLSNATPGPETDSSLIHRSQVWTCHGVYRYREEALYHDQIFPKVFPVTENYLQVKQVAIGTLEEQAIETVLPEHGQRIGQSDRNSKRDKEAKSLETNGGPARI